jgi:hypothetical protein
MNLLGLGAGEAEMVESLTSKCEAQSSNPRTIKKKKELSEYTEKKPPLFQKEVRKKSSGLVEWLKW